MEIWKPVVGYEGLYEVSDQGRVRSLDKRVLCRGGKTRRIPGRMLKPQKHSAGYSHVRLCERTLLIHALVLAAFVGPRMAGRDCAHGNGIKTDNRLCNLRYATKSENQMDRVAHGTSGRGARNPMAKLTAQQVAEIRASGQMQKALAAKHGVRQSQISRIKLGQRW